MIKDANGNGITQLRSDQRSGEVQYEHASFSIGTSGNSEPVDVSIGYRRSLDFDAKNSPGQDFAAVQGDDNGNIVGVVADGVSQSFYGDLAAYHLSGWLLDTLWHERERPPSEDKLKRKLKELEATIAAEYVDNFPIPDDLAPLHRESLEDKRSKGSQTVFAAFVLNASRKRLHLYQVGDVDAIVHYPDKSPKPIKAPPKGRWSSAGKSEMRLQLTTCKADDTSGIVIKSDGAGNEWGLRETVFTRSAFELLSEKRAGIDDVSFVAARWGNWLEGPETELERPLPEAPRVSRPRRKTESMPDMKRYEPDSSPRTPLPGKETSAPDYGSRDPRGRRERGTTVMSGPRIRTRRHNRPGNLPLLAVGIVSGILIVSLLLIVLAIILPLFTHPPEARDDAYSMSMARGELVVPPPGVLRNDRDEDKEDRKNLQVKLIRDASNGRVELRPNGSVSYWPKPGFHGEDSFVYSAVDTHGKQDTAEATITVRAPTSWWQRLRDLFGGRQ